MIVGGIVLSTLVEGFLVVGVSVTIAGIIGLVTLLPQVRAWIDTKANGSANGSTNSPPVVADAEI